MAAAVRLIPIPVLPDRDPPQFRATGARADVRTDDGRKPQEQAEEAIVHPARIVWCKARHLGPTLPDDDQHFTAPEGNRKT